MLGLLLVPNVIVVNRSVEWWRSLHQDSTLVKLDPTIEGDMLVALMVGFVAMGLVFTWLMIHRFRVAWLEQQADRVDLDAALLAGRPGRGGRPRRCGAADAGATSDPGSEAPTADDQRAGPHDRHDPRRLRRRRLDRHRRPHRRLRPRLLRRGRKLSRQVPTEERRWS